MSSLCSLTSGQKLRIAESNCLEGGGCNVSQVPCFQVLRIQWIAGGLLRLVEPY